MVQEMCLRKDLSRQSDKKGDSFVCGGIRSTALDLTLEVATRPTRKIFKIMGTYKKSAVNGVNPLKNRKCEHGTLMPPSGQTK